MDGWLKQSTAIAVPIGAFVDSTGAALTGLTISQADAILVKHGSTTFAQKNDSTTCTHRSNGMYTCPLDTTDTNTLGCIGAVIAETGALIVRHTWMITPANVWDSLFGADRLFVDSVEFNSVAGAAAKAAIAFNVMATGACVTDGSNSPTTFKTDLASSVSDYIVNRLLYMTSGTLAGQFWKIGDFNGSTKFATAAGAETFTGTPANTDTFIIL